MESFLSREKNTISEHKIVFGKRPLFFTAVFFLMGLLAGSFFEPKPFIPFIAAGVFIALHIVLSLKGLRFGGFALLVAAALIGMGVFPAHMSGLDSQTAPEGIVSVTGRIREVNTREYGAIYRLTNVTVDGERLENGVFVSFDAGFALDDIVCFEGELRKPDRKTYAFDFDDRLYCAANGVALRMSAEDAVTVGRERDILARIGEVRADIAKRMDELFLGASPVAKAMLLGMDDSVDAETMDSYRASGISHVLCVSGLHVSVMCYSVYLLLKKLRVRRGISYAVCLIVLILYAALAGFRLSVLRAAVMFAILMTAELTGERSDALTSLAAAFVALTAANPASIFDAGFQLSFAAVFAIICIAGSVPQPKGKLKTVTTAFAASAAAFLGTFLILLNMNGDINLLSLLLSPFSVLLATLLLPVIAISTLVYCIFGGITAYLGYVSIYLIALQNTLAGISEMITVSRQAPAVYGISVLACFAAIFAASKYTVLKPWIKTVICCVLVLAVPASWIGEYAFRPPVRVDVLAGRYDDCAVVTTKSGRCVLIDAGSGSAEYLLKYGLSADAVFLTASRAKSADGLSEMVHTQIFAPKEAVKDEELAAYDITEIKADSEFVLDENTSIFAYISKDGEYADYAVKYNGRTVFTYVGRLYSGRAREGSDAVYIFSETRNTEEYLFSSGARYAIIKNADTDIETDILDPTVCGRVSITAGEETEATVYNDN